MQSSQLKWAELDVPNAVIDFFKADEFAGTHDRDIDPLTPA
jgi:hypothetical protein